MIHFEYHPVADLFPLMPDPELEALSRDIEANGLREPIWLHPDGRIIDGRNRYRASMLVGVEPDTRTWDGEGSLVAFVVSLNLHRRHLNESQRAMVAADIKPMFEEEARARMLAGKAPDPGANLPEGPEPGRARDEAARAVGVSPRTVSHADTVKRSAAPELEQAVRAGEVSVSAAAEVARIHSPDVQRAVLAGGAKAVTEEAAKIRAEKRPARNDRVPQRLPYTQRMQDLIDAATNASRADDDELRAVPVNDLMLANVAKTRDLLTRFLAIHGKSDRTASA